uniref:AMP-binding domain-containing protein n=1 Tax=Globodera pallida TaxID=36090 RepID=A0A183CKQ3_GLOPA
MLACVPSYVDQNVIEFLQRIRRLFDTSGTTVYINTSYDQSRSWEIIRQKIWPLVNDNICRVLVSGHFQLDRLRRISPAILRRCANLRFINFYGLPEFPAEDNAGASSDQAVAKWLLTAREDGLPKTLCCCCYSEGMDELKRSFVNATGPVNFIVSFKIYEEEDDNFVPFELENNWTAERLTFRQMHADFWLLVRCPIVREEAKWAKWEKETIQGRWVLCSRPWNSISIDFEDKDIGDGKVKAKASCLNT